MNGHGIGAFAVDVQLNADTVNGARCYTLLNGHHRVQAMLQHLRGRDGVVDVCIWPGQERTSIRVDQITR